VVSGSARSRSPSPGSLCPDSDDGVRDSRVVCFSRSSARFERWLRANRWLGPSLQRWASGDGMPRSAKQAALAVMWTAVVLVRRSRESPWGSCRRDDRDGSDWNAGDSVRRPHRARTGGRGQAARYYSARSAVTGFIAIARREGSHIASRPTIPRRGGRSRLRLAAPARQASTPASPARMMAGRCVRGIPARH
jgi:Protein of unknown function (DUF454)